MEQTDRSAIETDWVCGMKYWWNRCEGGQGIVPAEEADYFSEGRDVHADLAALLRGTALDAVLDAIPAPANTTSALEVWTRRRGWLIAFARYMLPAWQAHYNSVMAVEQELFYRHGDLVIACQPDALLLTRTTPPRVVYREFKTVSGGGLGWILSWPYAIQMHIGLAAVHQGLGHLPAWGNVIGLEKGQQREGKLMHPYTWAWVKHGVWSARYMKGWDRAPVWDYPEGLIAWVEKLGEATALRLFPASAPIILNQRLLDTMLDRRAIREREIRAVKDQCQTDLALRSRYFEQRFSQCRPARGRECPYLSCCFNETVGGAPTAHGYVVRTPHHSAWTEGEDDRDLET